jgi:hypothetical protein
MNDEPTIWDILAGLAVFAALLAILWMVPG